MNTQMNLSANELFDKRVHRLGMSTILVAIILTLLVPLIIWLVLGVMPPLKNLINGIITVSSFMILLSVAEILAFYPILGSSGMYMAYTTGNIANLKLPSAAIAMEVADVKPSTREGDVISTIAMAGSVIVSEIILVIGVILLVPISNSLNNPVLKPAFEQILPALFGALGAYYILKEWKLAVVPLTIGIIFSSIGEISTAITVPVCVLLSVFGARILYKRGHLGEN